MRFGRDEGSDDDVFLQARGQVVHRPEWEASVSTRVGYLERPPQRQRVGREPKNWLIPGAMAARCGRPPS